MQLPEPHQTKAIQSYLRDAGFYHGAIDGDWGPLSRAAYTDFLATQANVVKASSFADPADVAEFRKWFKIYCGQGMSEALATQAAFKKGDNGIGFTGILCATEDECLCALPPEDWKAKWGDAKTASGKGVIVTYKGKEVAGRLGDTMPARATALKQNGCLIDLNPGYAKAFGLTPPFTVEGVAWRWA